MLLGNKVSGRLHHAITFFGGWFRYRFLSGGWLCLGVWSFRLFLDRYVPPADGWLCLGVWSFHLFLDRYVPPADALLFLGVWSFHLWSFRRRSFLFRNRGCHFLHCGCFGFFRFCHCDHSLFRRWFFHHWFFHHWFFRGCRSEERRVGKECRSRWSP